VGPSAQAQLLQKKAPSLEAARKMVAAAEAEAERNHWCGVVAVVDEGGWVILIEKLVDDFYPKGLHRRPA
jgi:glc operon protein GlcG